MAKDKEVLRLLGDGAEKNPRRRYGKQQGKMVRCSVKPDIHSFHPEYEQCPDCTPEDEPMPSWGQMEFFFSGA